MSKADGDVNHILFAALPRASPGALIQVHDVLYPFENPKEWLERWELGAAWNEP